MSETRTAKGGSKWGPRGAPWSLMYASSPPLTGVTTPSGSDPSSWLVPSIGHAIRSGRKSRVLSVLITESVLESRGWGEGGARANSDRYRKSIAWAIDDASATKFRTDTKQLKMPLTE